MQATGPLRVRRSLTDIQADYESGNKTELENLWRAWKGIQELPPDDPNSFFVIGGYHGEPFRGAGWGTSAYWGGYCNHGNVLFPTWHRAYLVRLEDALRSIPGCADVTLPFWDETSDESATGGIPWALTVANVELDGQTIPNPLRSFVLPKSIVDNLSPFPDADYSKPKGYETVRYPLSGLVGPGDIDQTKAHNAMYPDYDQNVTTLNANIVSWLTAYAVVVNGKPIGMVRREYQECLDAPNYTVFSNTTSATEWNGNADVLVKPLESPHNHIHLAVGGYELPNQPDFSPIQGANGDMGENDTAGLDPIFFFHHCHVDRMFWLWQQRHNSTGTIEIIEGYPGTNSVDNQGPTPGVPPNSWLDIDSPLAPFVHADGTAMTSRDCVNIETQLGYTYGPGSLDELATPPAAAAAAGEAAPGVGVVGGPKQVISVRGINRTKIPGSFLVSAYVNVDGERHHVGTESVLSRWHVEGCMNCQTHLEAKAHFHVPQEVAGTVRPEQIEVELHRRKAPAGRPVLLTSEQSVAPGFRVQVR